MIWDFCTENWDKLLTTIFTFIGLVLSIIAICQTKTNKQISIQANTYAKEAKNAAKEANEISKRSNISRFEVQLISIDFDNDVKGIESVNEVINQGSLICKFRINNLTDNEALFPVIESNRNSKTITKEFGNNRLTKDNPIDLTYRCSAITLIQKDDPNNYTNYYKASTFLKWDNGAFNCSCKINFYLQFFCTHKHEWSISVQENVCQTENYDIQIL